MWMYFWDMYNPSSYLPELKACVPHHIMKSPAKDILALPIVILAFWPLNPVLGFNIIAPTKPRENNSCWINSNINVFIRAELTWKSSNQMHSSRSSCIPCTKIFQKSNIWPHPMCRQGKSLRIQSFISLNVELSNKQ